MPIVSTDIDYKLSGGAVNSDGDLSIGGIISSSDAGTALHDLFDVVGSAESLAGDVEYRLVYIQNNHGTITAQNVSAFIESQTSSADTDIAIGLSAAANNATESAIADENTVPAGVTFTSPSSDGAGLTFADLAPGDYRGLWIRRTVNAASSAVNADTSNLRVAVDTAA